MSVSGRAMSAGGMSLLAVASLSPKSEAADGLIDDLIEGTDEFGLAVEAYIFGYPLVTMEMTRRVITNVTLLHVGGHSEVYQR